MTVRYSDGLKNKSAGQLINLVTNGDFETDTSGWTGDGATLTRDATGGVGASGALSIANSGAAAGKAHTDITTVVGDIYFVSFNLPSGDAGGAQLLVGTAADEDAAAISPVYAVGADTNKFAFVATDTTTRLTFVVDSTTQDEFVLLDAISVDALDDGVRGVFEGGGIALYTGPQPTSANDAASGTLIADVNETADSGEIVFDGASNGSLSLPSGVLWEGTNVATGSYGYGRIYEKGADPNAASTTDARLDFSIGTSGADLNLGNISATAGASSRFTSFSLSY